MSEYTPDTERIRLVFRMGGSDADARLTREDVFDRWLAAHDAEVRADEAAQWAQAVIDSGKQGERIGAARAGVVAEEPEWEYAYEVDGYWDDSEFVVEGYRRVGELSAHALARRRKAGPWVPVKQEGADDDV